MESLNILLWSDVYSNNLLSILIPRNNILYGCIVIIRYILPVKNYNKNASNNLILAV
jgi:hypothetical protein